MVTATNVLPATFLSCWRTPIQGVFNNTCIYVLVLPFCIALDSKFQTLSTALVPRALYLLCSVPIPDPGHLLDRYSCITLSIYVSAEWRRWNCDLPAQEELVCLSGWYFSANCLKHGYIKWQQWRIFIFWPGKTGDKSPLYSLLFVHMICAHLMLVASGIVAAAQLLESEG